MELFMKANGKSMSFMGLENLYMQMMMYMMVNGIRVKDRV